MNVIVNMFVTEIQHIYNMHTIDILRASAVFVLSVVVAIAAQFGV